MAPSACEIEALRNPGRPGSGLKTCLISRSIFFPRRRSGFEIPIRIVDFLKNTEVAENSIHVKMEIVSMSGYMGIKSIQREPQKTKL